MLTRHLNGIPSMNGRRGNSATTELRRIAFLMNVVDFMIYHACQRVIEDMNNDGLSRSGPGEQPHGSSGTSTTRTRTRTRTSSSPIHGPMVEVRSRINACQPWQIGNVRPRASPGSPISQTSEKGARMDMHNGNCRGWGEAKPLAPGEC